MLVIPSDRWGELSTTGQWLIVWVAVTVLTCLACSVKWKSIISLVELMRIGGGYTSTGLALPLGWRAIFSEELQRLLGADIGVLILGVSATLWLSMSQVIRVYRNSGPDNGAMREPSNG